MTDTFWIINLGYIDKKKCMEEDKKRLQDRLLQKQNKKALVYVSMELCNLLMHNFMVPYGPFLDKPTHHFQTCPFMLANNRADLL